MGNYPHALGRLQVGNLISPLAPRLVNQEEEAASNALQANYFSGTACLKWKKRFLAVGFPIFWGRWSDQTFFESSIKTKTENICSC